ncbi:MAG: hypothetical protein ABI682_08590 [Acidobacteriota bacterium]
MEREPMPRPIDAETGRYVLNGPRRTAEIRFMVAPQLKAALRSLAAKRGQLAADVFMAAVKYELECDKHGRPSPVRLVEQFEQAMDLARTASAEQKDLVRLLRQRDVEIAKLREQLADEKMVEVTEGVGLARKWLKTVLTDGELDNFAAIPVNEKAANWARLTGVLVHKLGVPRRLKSGRPTISAADLWLYVRDFATPAQRAAIKNCLLGTEREDERLSEVDDVERA